MCSWCLEVRWVHSYYLRILWCSACLHVNQKTGGPLSESGSNAEMKFSSQRTRGIDNWFHRYSGIDAWFSQLPACFRIELWTKATFSSCLLYRKYLTYQVIWRPYRICKAYEGVELHSVSNWRIQKSCLTSHRMLPTWSSDRTQCDISSSILQILSVQDRSKKISTFEESSVFRRHSSCRFMRDEKKSHWTLQDKFSGRKKQRHRSWA